MALETPIKTVVLCEDEAATLFQLKKLLEHQGFEVLAVATDGRESVDQVLRERPDVVLMDINLPNLDGIEATRRIMGTYHSYQPCVVVVTAYADEAHRAEALEAGACAYVVKPFDPAELVDIIRRALQQSSGPAAA